MNTFQVIFIKLFHKFKYTNKNIIYCNFFYSLQLINTFNYTNKFNILKKYILLNKEMAQKNKLPVENGALIMRENLGESAIIKGSPAEKAGFKEFDIITECQGKKITEKNPLSHLLQKLKVGNKIILKILRNKKELKIKVRLEEKN